MFSSTIKVQRGFCSCCKKAKGEDGIGKLYTLDIHDDNFDNPFSGTFTPNLVESEADFAACLKCWNFIGRYLVARIRIQNYA